MQPPRHGFQLFSASKRQPCSSVQQGRIDSFGMQPTTEPLCMTVLSHACDSLLSAPDSFTMQQQHRASTHQHSTSSTQLHPSWTASPCSLQQHIASTCQPCAIQFTASLDSCTVRLFGNQHLQVAYPTMNKVSNSQDAWAGWSLKLTHCAPVCVHQPWSFQPFTLHTCTTSKPVEEGHWVGTWEAAFRLPALCLTDCSVHAVFCPSHRLPFQASKFAPRQHGEAPSPTAAASHSTHVYPVTPGTKHQRRWS